MRNLWYQTKNVFCSVTHVKLLMKSWAESGTQYLLHVFVFDPANLKPGPGRYMFYSRLLAYKNGSFKQLKQFISQTHGIQDEVFAWGKKIFRETQSSSIHAFNCFIANKFTTSKFESVQPFSFTP